MKTLKENRTISFLIVGAVYLLATVLGIVLYKLLPFDWWLNLLLADVFATILTFIFSLIFDNASVYDPYWSVQPIVISTVFAFGKSLNLLSVLLLVAIWLWGIRLTANWAYTFGNLTCQDWRYTMLKEKTGAFYPIINFVGIHMVPTVVVYFCTLPAVYAIVFDKAFHWISIIFFAQVLVAVTLQTISDVQMHKYRKKRTTPFIRVGLWKYSRHPNYLGEILMWWSVGLMVVGTDFDLWYLLVGAVLNTLLFLFVSVPMADGRQSRKEGFAQYKKETRVFLPIKK